jgi:penicillin-binding protein 2
VIFLIISLQLFNLQILEGKENDEKSQKRLLRNSSITAPRGNILDRNNLPIAVNRMGYSVLVSRTSINAEELNEMIFKLIKIFEKNNDYYVNTLGKYITINPIAFGDYLTPSQQNIDKWISEIVASSKDSANIKSPQDVFDYLKGEKRFKISSKYNEIDTYKIMAIRYEMLVYGYTAVNPVFLGRDVSNRTVAEIAERHQEFPGVITEVVPMRRYIEGQNLAHVLGYIGKISEKEYSEKKAEGYSLNDLIGKTGIEYKVESFLRGKNGLRQLEVDTNGRLTSELSGIPALSGSEVILTIDSKLQKVAMKSLEDRINSIKTEGGRNNFGDAFAGAAVAMDVNSGEVLALASYPSYDPSVFLAGADDYESQKRKIQYLTDKQNIPMYNRATKGIYIPGSIFKPLTAIAALEEGVVSSNEKIYDSGDLNIGGRVFYCLEKRLGYGAHGNLDLAHALGTSCNIYFHEIGVRVGIDKISKWCQLFGLGAPTGIDLPGEEKGLLGDKEFKKSVIKEGWYPADTAQTAIGQLYNSFTPIQIVNYVSSIANGGKRYKPFLIKKIIKNDGTLAIETKPEFVQIPVKPETISAVQDGMISVTNATDGTAVAAFKDFPFKVAGKTGTPETGFESGKQSSNALFICYAPAEKPRIAVAVVIERGVWGANAAPIATDILREYFGLNAPQSSEEKAVPEKVVLTR